LSRSRSLGNVPLKKGDANLPKKSVVNVSQLQTMDKAELTERVGKLPAGTVDAIRCGLQLLFDRI
jgi:mRNA interferase MazF